MNTCRICWKEIWKTYSDKKLRCSSCRKSVENAIWYNERTVEYVEDELFAWKEEYKKLKKENKKLKENIEQLKNQRIFNSTEYDLITLTSTTPQWELRRK